MKKVIILYILLGLISFSFYAFCQTRVDSLFGDIRFKGILVDIIFRVLPFFLQFSPKSFSDVQGRGIGRKKENEQSPFPPIRNPLLVGFSLFLSHTYSR